MAARFQTQYRETVVPELMKQFPVPRLQYPKRLMTRQSPMWRFGSALRATGPNDRYNTAIENSNPPARDRAQKAITRTTGIPRMRVNIMVPKENIPSEANALRKLLIRIRPLPSLQR